MIPVSLIIPLVMYLWLTLDAAFIIIRMDNLGTLHQSRSRRGLSADPLESLSREGRQVLCDDVLLAKIYNHLPITYYPIPNNENSTPVDLANENFQRVATCHSPTLRYLARHILMGRGNCPKVKIFPCRKTNTHKWYVTYGFEENQMFLVEQLSRYRRGDLYFKITAIIEPRSIFVRNVYEIFENRVHREVIPFLHRSTRLVPMSVMEQIRLCSSVFDVMSDTENGFFREDVRHENYVRAKSRYRYKNIRMRRYPHTITRMIKVMACSINRDAKSHQLYVLADPITRGAAFAFVNGFWGRNEIYLVGRAEQVPVLMEDSQARVGPHENVPPP